MGRFAQILCISLIGCIPGRRTLPVELNEISGWVLDSDSTAVAINDSGNAGRLWRVNLHSGAAERFGDSLTNVDWEALAYDRVRDQYLVCDVGDNRRVRETIAIHRVDPNGSHVQSQVLRYPDGPHDCEACLVRDDTLTLITKARTLNGGKRRVAYVYEANLRVVGDLRLSLRDSFVLKRRSVTDAVWLGETRLAVLAYNFQLIGPLPFANTTIYTGTWSSFRQNEAQRTHLRAPFTLTQYESIATDPGSGALYLASERTIFIPARWRRLATAKLSRR